MGDDALRERYEDLLKRLLAELRGHYGPRLVSVAVFGSVGRGAPREGSDIDILIVARDLPRGRTARVEAFLPVEDRLAPWLRRGRPAAGEILLSPVFKTPEELEAGTPLLLDMVEDARILFDDEGVLAQRLERLRARLRELGARRVWRGATWYWELKPDFKPGDVIIL